VNEQEVFDELKEIGSGLEQVNVMRDGLYRNRTGLFLHGADQGITYEAMAEAAGCKVGAVTQAIRRAREKE
jgi:DNA-directed RNA polymerase specialized sigma24 family protein